MHNRLKERFEHEIERYAEIMFNGRVGQNAFVQCGREHPNMDERWEYFKRLMELGDRAVQAREWFARIVSCRYQPLPLLFYPTKENILCSGDLHRHLVVFYTGSLQQLNFDYLEHPEFFTYARGVMAHPDGPSYVQSDPHLLVEFPPRPLPGLVDGYHWRPPV